MREKRARAPAAQRYANKIDDKISSQTMLPSNQLVQQFITGVLAA